MHVHHLHRKIFHAENWEIRPLSEKMGYPHTVFKFRYGYSSEAPQRCISNVYTQHMFLWRNKKNISMFWLKKKTKKTLYLGLWSEYRNTSTCIQPLNCQSQLLLSALSSACDFKSHFLQTVWTQIRCSFRPVCKNSMKSLQEYSADDINRRQFHV